MGTPSLDGNSLDNRDVEDQKFGFIFRKKGEEIAEIPQMLADS